MKILLAVVGGLLLLIFPFIVMKKAKVTKEENTDEARKKFNVFLICMIPVPLIGFIFLFQYLVDFLTTERIAKFLHVFGEEFFSWGA